MKINSYVVFLRGDFEMIATKKEFVKELNCDELCAISKKREIEQKMQDKRMKKLADTEMNQKLCPPCGTEEFIYT